MSVIDTMGQRGKFLIKNYFNRALLLGCVFVVLTVVSCSETHTPKPRGYFRISFPEKTYSDYTPEKCPYSFELPDYSMVASYSDSITEPCWKYLRFPAFNAEIFLSYKKVDRNVSHFIEDARTLAFKHSVKADIIDETLVETPNQVYGLIYDIGGSAASSVQFYATDSVNHFLRGALYFNHTTQPDSLAPVIQFLRQDVVRLMTTLRWK
jgi:gliding motility-associated lipoprotein GldD